MNVWCPVTIKPEKSGWYVTARVDLPSRSVPRYFDNSAKEGVNWYIARDNGGGDCLWEEEDEDPLVVNMSFDMWCELPVMKVL